MTQRKFDYDLVVIGGGSGGVRAARMAAGFGARVALVESHRLGGTCVNVGCVPKKLLVTGARYVDAFQDAKGFGWSVDATVDWNRLRTRVLSEVQRLNGIYGGILDRAQVEQVPGRGVVHGPHEVKVGERTLHAAKILIATGGRPRRPELPGAEHAAISDDFFELETLPKRAVLIGGGYIGVEFTSILTQLGVEVHLVHRHPELLNHFDADVATHFTEAFGVHPHVHLHLDRSAASIAAGSVTLNDGQTIEADFILFTAGRVPNIEGLFANGPAALGIETKARDALVVNDTYQTGCPSIFAVGDVIDRMALTPVALAEGMSFARHQFAEWSKKDARVAYDCVATAVFSTPEVATVGLSEADARKRGGVRIFLSTFRPMKFVLAERQERSLMKLVVDAESDRVLGVHVVGPDAGEIMQGFAAALNAGITKRKLDQTIGIHPTAAEELVTMREATR